MKNQAKPLPLPKATKSAVKSLPPAIDDSFPIVGIGASAGGLEALEQFLHHVPARCGMAFVIIQHLDPARKGIMVELLQRATAMPVVQVKDRQTVEPDSVYVIPPNRDMSLLHGVLHLLEPAAPRGLRLPIDFFFRSLAADRQDGSIGVILSGMGSDGTLGLRAIKEEAGLTLVQDPATAKFDGMPRSAIDTGVADVIAPAEALPSKIVTYLSHTPSLPRPDLPLDDKAQSALEKIVILLRAHTGHDFSLYKKSTIYRRIERRMGLHQLARIADYVRYLRANPQEADLLFKELLIGVTSFFRDQAAWEQLKGEVIPALVATRPQGGVLRAWTPGCSTGEEAYSLAIAFKEAIGQAPPAKNLTLQIYATDLDRDAIDKARTGLYPANIAADVSEERLNRFFVQDERGGYRVNKEIRDMVIFATQNLVMDPPFTKLDILTCRNLLIYLAPELQKKLLPLFHYSLSPDGFLFLGSAETIGTFSHLFAPLTGKMRLYRRLESARRAEPVEFPSSFSAAQPEATVPSALFKDRQPAVSLQTLADHLLLQQYSPPAVLTSDKGDILYISGRTGKYLEPAAGKANWNIFAMAREGLRYTLNDEFQKALRKGETVTLRGVKVGTNGGSQFVDITIQPLTEPEALRGMALFVFRDVPPPPEAAKRSSKRQRVAGADARLAQMEHELQQAREETQTTREEMQTSQEELKSTNEELQSTNEELQSTNEELTTSKEEMQSMNEELQTVNHELQAKVDELSWASNDMKNLLNSTDIATIFLDDGLRLRRFTTQAARIIKLIPGDVGRPITDIASTLIYPDLTADTEEVLRTLVFKEKSVAESNGRWFSARVMPYRTQENKIDGVVITFTDVTLCKRLEKVVGELAARVQLIMAHSSDPFFSLDKALAVTSCNPAAERMLGRKASEALGRPFADLIPEAKGALFTKRCGQALAKKCVLAFTFPCTTAPYQGRYAVRVYPHADGIFVSFQRGKELRA